MCVCKKKKNENSNYFLGIELRVARRPGERCWPEISVLAF